MEDQVDGMAVCEPPITNESTVSNNSIQSTDNTQPAYPRFMTPISPSHQLFPPNSGLSRRPSVDRPKQPRPETPTRSLPVSSNRPRQKTWASVASKGVDAFRSTSAKSTNYSKRTPYKNGQSPGVSTPCPDRNSKECNYNACIQTVADKKLASEKPLPYPPGPISGVDSTCNLDIHTSVETSKDQSQHPPSCSPSDKEWATTASEQAEDSKEDTTSDAQPNGNDEIKLTRIEEENAHTPIPDGVRMFADALSKLTKATACMEVGKEGEGQKSEVQEDYPSESSAAEAASPGSTKWCTSALSQSSTESPFSPPRKPQNLKIVTDFYRNPVQTERSFAYHGTGVSPGYYSRVPKSNPFRDRPRVASSPGSMNHLLTRDNRASSCSFKHSPSPIRTPGAMTPKQKPMGTPTPSNPYYPASLTTTPRTDKSGSKIPRMSPRNLFPESDSGAGHSSKTTVFSPSKRSSIPLPTRMLQQNREDNGPENVPEGTTPSAIFDRVEKITTNGAVAQENPSGMDKGNIHSSMNLRHESQGEMNSKTEGMEENADPFSDDITVKQLSKSAPCHGPQLRISSEAERLIMGEDDIKVLEKNMKESRGPSRGPSRQSGHKREFRLSTDSLFATFSSKRSKSSSYRLSFSGKPPAEEGSPTPAGGPAGKSISKAKSAEFGIRRASSGHRSMRRKSSPEKELPHPASGKLDADPFLDTEGKDLNSKQSASIDREPVAELGKPNEAPCSSPVIESAKKSSIPVAVTDNSPSPSKSAGPVERTRKSQNEASKVNSPRSPRHNSKVGVTYGSPRRYPHRPSTDRAHYRPRPNNDIHIGPDQPSSHNADSQGQKDKRHKKRHHRSADPITTAPEPIKGKGSSSKGVFSNFRGLFSKNKSEAPKEIMRPLISYAKPTVTSNFKLSVPASQSVPHLGASGSGIPSGMSNGDISYRHLEPPRSPALRDTGRISTITMEILDSARNEVDTSRKEKLIRLGKILIEAVNNSHDAEKAMLTAIQAAKEAEVACAMAKENAMKMSQVACDWARPLASAKGSSA
ncbi:uncharacterized protein ARB_01827 [Trichophyton benhamiae CBS 112371]|uniref:Uncharacterized protein n=1 Tax=Arthroderma benhamiae (strain ATCC MYA-4681 / CBS 112371) TaxID=663331 RepID=D4B056_ARTBC|nr:uncharacterized protein ARB_01827 [Trichophyton benhamiae CBS 112371]EFE31208.1 hypothetical protein ARB_01827 [Trichophyton benhamiae CBS 112371]